MGAKAIQVSFDEALLKRLDRHRAIRHQSRSAVLRDAAADYLRRQEDAEIDRRYAVGYGNTELLQTELRDWEHEGVWPQD